MTLDDTFTACDDVVSREVEGEAVILSLETSTYFGLDPVGTHIWRLIAEGRSLRAILDTLVGEYAAESDVLERDLLQIVGDLEAKRLIRRPAE